MFTAKRLLTAACLTAPLLVSASANAIIVTDWNYELNSAFTAYEPVGVDASIPNASLGGFTRLEWGTPISDLSLNPTQERSSLSIDNAGLNTGSVQTNNGPVDTSIYTHNNFVITGTALTSATLLDVLTLDPELPVPPAVPGPGDSFSAPALTFEIQFIETQNFWTPDNPTVANRCPEGVPWSEAFGCGDIFVLNVEGAGFDSETLSFIQLFPFAGELYAASIFLHNTETGTGLQVLSDEACARAGAESGCVGMVTAEGLVNQFQAAFSIAHLRTIPEPGVLALMALGLLAMGGLQRKRSA